MAFLDENSIHIQFKSNELLKYTRIVIYDINSCENVKTKYQEGKIKI